MDRWEKNRLSHRADAFPEARRRPVPLMEDWHHAGFGLYLHWPFCQSKCPYCDFNSHVAARVDQSRWLTAFQAEIDRIGALTQGRVLNTVFFGGGTPIPDGSRPSFRASLTASAPPGRWRMTSRSRWKPTPARSRRPGSRAMRKAGVNRVSLGIQSLDADDLRRLGRMHSVDEAANGHRHGAVDVRPRLDRPDLCPPGPDPCRLARRTAAARSTLARRTCRFTS